MVAMLGGPPTPGIGFGIGIERVLLSCDAEGVFAVAPAPLDVYVVDVAGGGAARDLTTACRRAGLRADRSFDGRSMKAQMKAANRAGARVALIVGDAEVAADSVTVRRLSDGAQEQVPRSDVVARVMIVLEGEAE
jgi:histidyl-tRNA synthetase